MLNGGMDTEYGKGRAIWFIPTLKIVKDIEVENYKPSTIKKTLEGFEMIASLLI